MKKIWAVAGLSLLLLAGCSSNTVEKRKLWMERRFMEISVQPAMEVI